ncbi:ATP-binding protein [Oceanirhabdus sp. W0125-5]|uniref:ATP-binding protein n=1 Tax=Oceanirhabdus sp. W0125-5 TaxID=2999116 RepID=UPI0022F2FAC1|nr:sensor histidine kinase [Oceanirhabdus sp. W0125-5]WBW97104.1 sensor histidine kinase [Oceanirhabdus sp. W0125-5]
MKLQNRLMIFFSAIMILVIGSIGCVTYHHMQVSLEEQMGNNAMDLAVTISSMDIIEKTLATSKEYEVVQETIDDFSEKTRFQYIIVMDMEGIKYSYPYGNTLGRKYNDGGEERVLQEGESYVSKDSNKLITAIRAYAPIYYDGEQVGAVVVGLLTDTVYQELRTQLLFFRITIVVGIIIGIISAALLSNSIKKTIFGLEPKEIALLLGQRNLVLQSLKDGILAIDNDGKIMLINDAAKKILALKDDDLLKDISILNKNYTESMMEALRKRVSIYNQEIKIGHDKTLVCSHTILKNHKDETIGVVSSFKDLTEIKHMAEELAGTRKMTCALRAQNHEFMNKLHTISGLIQLEEYDEAIEYISDISHERQEVSNILNKKINNVHIAGLLLAKYNKATEAKISMEIDPKSNMEKIPDSVTVEEVCSIVGNLIENSMDELVKYEEGKIFVKLNSDENGLSIRVKDNGPGIPEDIRDKIFERGFTTKSGSRGFGLSIIKQIIEYAEGSIEISQDNGAVWDIFIPMERS